MIVAGILCDKCSRCCSIREENEFAEIICDDCEQNANEAAWERVCEAFHDGGATSFLSIRDRQEAARRLK